MSVTEFLDSEPGQPPVRGFLHRPEGTVEDALVLTHGAGSNCRSPLLVALANEFCDRGIAVLRVDLPFRQLRAYGPPRGSADMDQQGLKRAVELIRRQASGRVFLGGHSYGGRQASMLAADHPDVADGLLLLSYPLHPPKKPEQMRTAHFPRLQTPVLFVYGTRDGFGTAEELQEAANAIRAKHRLLAIEGAGHELLSKKTGDSLPQMVAREFIAFFLS